MICKNIISNNNNNFKVIKSHTTLILYMLIFKCFRNQMFMFKT